MLCKYFLSSLGLMKAGAVYIQDGQTSFTSCTLSGNTGVSGKSILNRMLKKWSCKCLCADTRGNPCCVTVHCPPLYPGGIMCV